MPRRIHVLPEKLANQIAAGEVVERPASVVKELVENALDAGAARVDVLVRNGGKTEIRVSDDGCGMGREDALLSVDRHATSKVRNEADLAAIRTLGFRGEALPSIASVSRMALETAEREGDGTRVVVTGGQLAAVEECARRRGTTVAVRSLFFNLPARAKFLRSTPAESRAVNEVVTTLALAHPGIAFTLDSGSREVLSLPAAAGVAERAAALWGTEFAADLIPVAHRAGTVAVSGLVQRPHRATPGSRRAYLFVNGRAFADRALLRAADRAYRTTVPQGVYASVLLYLEVPEAEVDVNVHPAKAEVRFRDRIGVERAVEEAVRGAVAGRESTPAIGVREAPGFPGYPPLPPGTGAAAVREPAPAPATAVDPESQMMLFVSGPRGKPPEGGNGAAPPREAVTGGAAAPEGGEAPAPPEVAGGHVTPMWQVHNTYILAETRGGLILVDQHAAHERVLYEELIRGFDPGVSGQRLLFPLTLRLSPAEYAMVEQISGILERAGFEVEPFGGRSIIVHAVPNPHQYFDAERCLREMITELTEGSELVDSARNQHQRIALSMACKGAIKAGQRLSQQEMAELFDRLFATEIPYHDIHGRPTVVQLSLAELHRRFGRSG
jgi:DNA mismatch repair protein MutL